MPRFVPFLLPSQGKVGYPSGSMKDQTSPEMIITGPRATITLRRPDEANRIDPADLDILLAHFAAAVANSAVRVLVITGLGERTFSSGYTIQAIRDHLGDGFERMLDTLETLPLPVICALNGSVYGGATDLALCCDFRIGVSGSRLLMPAAKIGLHYYPGGIRRYVNRLGLSAAKKLFLTALPIDADEMLRIGFLTELVEPAELQAEVTRYADALIAGEAGVIASMKQFLNQTADGNIDLAAQRAAYQRSLDSDALAERIAAMKKNKG
jgi:enoyl-CoA hydratase/carnithine racemase